MALTGRAATGLVWITRAEPGASQTARRLSALGHASLLAPLLTVAALPLPEPDLSGVGALAFTSANGVRAFAALTQRRDLPVYAVGGATASAAAAHGFSLAGQGDDGVAAMARLILSQRELPRGRILHPSAREPAGDLAGLLRQAGIGAKQLAVYESTPAKELPEPAQLALEQGAICAVLVHSPRAARTLEILSRTDRVRAQLSSVRVFGLSPACLTPLADLPFAARTAPERARSGDLLKLLD